VPVAPVIDPSLDASTDSSPKKPGVSIEVTQAAMQALLKSVTNTANVSTSRRSGSPVAAETIGNFKYPGSSDNDEVANADFDTEGDRDVRKADNVVEIDRNTSMEHVLTEDGEPMLNPGTFELIFYILINRLISRLQLAELLTSVCLHYSWSVF
jgi:hypothetical protein